MISKSDAVSIAAGWHSVMTWSDPGVTMYALSSTGRIQSPQHRVDLIAYLTTHCLPLAQRRAAAATGQEAIESCGVDLDELAGLLDYVNNAPLEPNPDEVASAGANH